MAIEFNPGPGRVVGTGPSFSLRETFARALDGRLLTLESSRIPDLIAEYVRLIETERTNKWCKCEWITHPDDEGIAENQCRNQNCKHMYAEHDERTHLCLICGCENYKARRLRRGEATLDCPVHTKEGFLLIFFEWAAKQ